MEEKRPLYWKRLLLSFFIATIIFISGFLISNMISYSKYQDISVAQEKLKYDLLSLELEEKLMKYSCELFDPYIFSEKMDNLGKIISLLEMRFGLFDEKVIEQKNLYSLLEVKHMISVEEYNEKCEESFDVILFFYSNKEENLDKAEKMGYILGFYKDENKRVMIYSFDYDLDNSIINILKRKYGVEKPNTIIINENRKILELNNIDELEL